MVEEDGVVVSEEDKAATTSLMKERMENEGRREDEKGWVTWDRV